MEYDYRSLVESLEGIMNEEEVEEIGVESEEESSEEELSPQKLLKEIVISIRGVIDAISSEEIEDYDAFLKSLKNVKQTLDSLHGAGYSTSHQDDVVQEELMPLDKIDGNEYGAGGMGPKIDSSGKQHYEKKSGSSYAERNGFVGP